MDIHILIMIYLCKANKNVKLSICVELSLYIQTLKFKSKIITNKCKFLFLNPKAYTYTLWCILLLKKKLLKKTKFYHYF